MLFFIYFKITMKMFYTFHLFQYNIYQEFYEKMLNTQSNGCKTDPNDTASGFVLSILNLYIYML